MLEGSQPRFRQEWDHQLLFNVPHQPIKERRTLLRGFHDFRGFDLLGWQETEFNVIDEGRRLELPIHQIQHRRGFRRDIPCRHLLDGFGVGWCFRFHREGGPLRNPRTHLRGIFQPIGAELSHSPHTRHAPIEHEVKKFIRGIIQLRRLIEQRFVPDTKRHTH